MPARRGGGVPALLQAMEDEAVKRPPFAPPYLRAGKLLIAQTANILQFLGPRLRLVPRDHSARIWVHQLQLTVADLVDEVHDTHHPIASSLYYAQQKTEARRRARYLTGERIPKYLDYFERVLAAHRGTYAVGRTVTYVDLSLFQLLAGLRYAYPRTLRRLEAGLPRLVTLHERVCALPRIAAYLASPRRIAFNEEGIFRHYLELDRAGR
jgi:glutathione S-transferase